MISGSAVPVVMMTTLVVMALPGFGDAQVPSAPATESWPTFTDPASPGDTGGVGQESRLPVYDDDGELIPYREIQELVDPSGSTGAFWGVLLGASVGGGLGALLTRCGGVRGGYRYYCSPQEESLRSRVPVGLAITIGLIGAWAGYETDRTTFDEAVAEIRRRRKVER